MLKCSYCYWDVGVHIWTKYKRNHYGKYFWYIHLNSNWYTPVRCLVWYCLFSNFFINYLDFNAHVLSIYNLLREINDITGWWRVCVVVPDSDTQRNLSYHDLFYWNKILHFYLFIIGTTIINIAMSELDFELLKNASFHFEVHSRDMLNMQNVNKLLLDALISNGWHYISQPMIAG